MGCIALRHVRSTARRLERAVARPMPSLPVSGRETRAGGSTSPLRGPAAAVAEDYARQRGSTAVWGDGRGARSGERPSEAPQVGPIPLSIKGV